MYLFERVARLAASKRLVLILAISLALGPRGVAADEVSKLEASEIRALIAGNTLVLEDPRRGYKMHYRENGQYVFDPAHGIPVEGQWFVREDDDNLCDWIVTPDKPSCNTVSVQGELVLLDWGEDWSRDYASRLVKGDATDPSDNPGAAFDPGRSLALPADLEIRAPRGEVPGRWAEISGAWYGSWFAYRDYGLVVETIDGTDVQVTYAWGPSKFTGGDHGWKRGRGRIEGDRLPIDMGGWSLTLRLRDGRLQLDGENADWAGRTIAVKWDDVPLGALEARAPTAPDPAQPREALTFWQLQIGEVIGAAPLHNDHFMPQGAEAAAPHRFQGRLRIGESKGLRRPAGSLRALEAEPFPPFAADFITVGDRLVPAERGILKTSRRSGVRWDIVLGPGRLWSEPEDLGWSRASFPFLLVEPLGGTGRNGVATFLFNDAEISHLRFQVAKEASPVGHLDIWGVAEASYAPGTRADHGALEAAWTRELADQIPLRRLSELAARADQDLVEGYDGGSIRAEISTSALIDDGTIYATPCRTRAGPFPYCREMRHGVNSITKSLVGWLAMLRLAETYGERVFDLKVADYVEIPAAHDGWAEVTFGHALDMVSGIGEVEPRRVDHYVGTSNAKSRALFHAGSLAEKLAVVGTIGRYPWGPGEVFRYTSHDPLVLSAAMDAFLKAEEGPEANLWEMMNREVFQPIGIAHLPTNHTLEPDGAPGVPLNGYGLFVTLEEVARIAGLIQGGGAHDGVQILHAARLKQSLSAAADLGKPTGWLVNNGDGEVLYLQGLWYEPQTSRAGCKVHVPMMSGAGGSSVLLMPNGMTGVRFAGGPDEDHDDGTWDQVPMRALADAIRPLCGDAG